MSRKATVWFSFSLSDLVGLAMRSHFVIHSGQRPRPASGWSLAKCIRRRRAAQGVKGASPLARAVFAENFAVGNSFCKHGCRALSKRELRERDC